MELYCGEYSFDNNYELLAAMYRDGYFPDFLVDKIKVLIQNVIVLLETEEKDLEIIQDKFDEMTLAINDLQEEFESNGCVYDVEIFHCGNTDIVRFYEAQNEQYGESLSGLVIAVPSYGGLQIQYISGDAVLTGTLNSVYFCKEMVSDII